MQRGENLHSVIYSVGHGTRSAEALHSLLDEAGVHHLVDVRTAPRSRRYPHFNREALRAFLHERGVEYTHLPGLGGWRRAASDSPHLALRVPGFRGYADHLSTEEFARDYLRLQDLARREPTAFMCAERHWWRCHRQILSDQLVVDGWEVVHLLRPGERQRHKLSRAARVFEDRLLYDISP